MDSDFASCIDVSAFFNDFDKAWHRDIIIAKAHFAYQPKELKHLIFTYAKALLHSTV